MELEFRKLRADEIEVRVGSISEYGVRLMLYKDARCDQAILDETVGPMRWQRHHSRDNANCIVSIYDSDLKEWVEKEDVGVESQAEKAKGLASDSFKRACFNWGIGRELYSASDLNLFIGKENLNSFTPPSQGNKGKCFDTFVVSDIKYNDKARRIENVTIDVYKGANKTYSKTFGVAPAKSRTQSAPQAAPQVAKPTQATQPVAKPQTAPTQTPNPTAQATPQPSNQALIKDDEIILIGNCKGKTYGEAKGTAIFEKFLGWVKTSSTNYTDPAQADQYNRFKALASA